MDMCSCSPTVFTFVLNLEGDCETNDIIGNPGIVGSFCFVKEEVVPSSGLEAFSWSSSEIDVDDEKKTSVGSNIIGRQLQDEDPVTEIVSVQFLEIDASGDLTVINQDDKYADVSLGDGATLTFNSVSSRLDTSLPLMDQPALVPGGVILTLYGKTESGVFVRNKFSWQYDMNCGRENDPVQTGDSIGWVTVVSIACLFLSQMSWYM